ncbi:MAG: exopolysaccharide biosynthesis polyprenyl glycosylphosphotransferase, partial [Thermoleophilia bacterium]|nr:exopolysaccharide biosynthesis polyprenyl glycosylphosphotransferase [Thermoleophilia bacterium]
MTPPQSTPPVFARAATAPRLVDAALARPVLGSHDVRSRAGGGSLGSSVQFMVKRLTDIVITLLLLVLLAPLFVLVMVAVWVTSPGPVIYRSTRVGLGAQRFGCLKFRTMRHGSDALQPQLEAHNQATGAVFKIENDPRVTAVGRWLRSSGLDELPQLINVLRGQMSLVGPRPLPLRDCSLLPATIWRRHSVVPGISGPWQLAPNRHGDEALLTELDLEYIDTWSLWVDVRVLTGTVWFGVRRLFTTDSELAGVRVLVVANEQVGARMAGPAIRASSIAGELAARGARVTLAMPAAPDDANAVAAGVRVATFGTPNARRFHELARAHDIVVTQPQRVDIAWALRRTGRPVVYDLYVPSFVERIAQLATEPMAPALKARLLERDRLEYAAAIELGSAFICATERQKDHWLGALGHAGRLDIGLLERDGRGDALIGVVPFGLASTPMAPLAAGDGAIRGMLVPDDAIVMLWTGGIWNWFDPVTVVEGLARARERDARLHLVVLGMHHPEAAWEEQDASRALRQRADELGLLADGGVVLTDTWVPFAERH